jgi:hypothetical protein
MTEFKLKFEIKKRKVKGNQKCKKKKKSLENSDGPNLADRPNLPLPPHGPVAFRRRPVGSYRHPQELHNPTVSWRRPSGPTTWPPSRARDWPTTYRRAYSPATDAAHGLSLPLLSRARMSGRSPSTARPSSVRVMVKRPSRNPGGRDDFSCAYMKFGAMVPPSLLSSSISRASPTTPSSGPRRGQWRHWARFTVDYRILTSIIAGKESGRVVRSLVGHLLPWRRLDCSWIPRRRYTAAADRASSWTARLRARFSVWTPCPYSPSFPQRVEPFDSRIGVPLLRIHLAVTRVGLCVWNLGKKGRHWVHSR